MTTHVGSGQGAQSTSGMAGALRASLVIGLLLAGASTAAALDRRTLISQVRLRPLAHARRSAAGVGRRDHADQRWLHLAGHRRGPGPLRRRALHRLRHHQFRADRQLHLGPGPRARRLVVGAHPRNAVPVPRRNAAVGLRRALDWPRLLADARGPGRRGLERRRRGRHGVLAERRVPASAVRCRGRRRGGDRAAGKQRRQHPGRDEPRPEAVPRRRDRRRRRTSTASDAR